MMTWTVDISFLEDPDHTQAIANLRAPDGRKLRGVGQARRNPDDRSVPAIGEEIAAARALSSLAHELLNLAANEIEKNVVRGDPVV